MNTQKATTVTIVLIVVVIVALFGWAALRGTHIPNTRDNISPSSALPSGTGALASILGSPEDMKCTFTFDTLTLGKGEGVALINKKGNLRSDIVSTLHNTTSKHHILNDGTFVYTWSNTDGGVPAGIILRLNAETTMDIMRDKSIPAIETIYGDVTYTCAPWAAEATVYIPPPQVKFVDFGLALQQIIEGVPIAQ